MVESPKVAHIHFTRLTRSELSEKLNNVASKRTRVVFWKTSPKFYEGLSFHFRNENNKSILTITESVVAVKFSNEKICLNFVLNDIEYFFRGTVQEHNVEEELLRIEILEECFKLEKRSRDRLQAFPKYEVFTYLKYFIDSPKNVIQFNKLEQKNKDFLGKLNDIRLQKLTSISDDLNLEEEEDIVGFRVEDISSNGLSFLASQSEKEGILDNYVNTTFKITVNFEMQAYSLDEAKIIYIMDYINPDFIGTHMYKVGVTFKYSPSLKRRIEEISGISLSIIDYQKEFEEFIKNE